MVKPIKIKVGIEMINPITEVTIPATAKAFLHPLFVK